MLCFFFFFTSVCLTLQNEITGKSFTDSQFIALRKCGEFTQIMSWHSLPADILICHNRKNHRCH